MALFVDGPLATIDDLTDNDSGLLDVALTTGINLTTKLRLTHEEIDTNLQLRLQTLSSSATVVAGQGPRIEQVVYTVPLKRWETMLTLAFTYRDAYFSQLVDRYKERWDAYEKLASLATEQFVGSGIGFVSDPMPRAAAPFLSAVTGPQNGGFFYASVSWVNAAGQEGAASDPSSLAVMDGHLMTVSAVNAPANAVGFNVYAGAALDQLTLQNNVALPASASFTYVPGASASSRQPGNGQMPDTTRPLARSLLRG